MNYFSQNKSVFLKFRTCEKVTGRSRSTFKSSSGELKCFHKKAEENVMSNKFYETKWALNTLGDKSRFKWISDLILRKL